jgi:hypothetical protein
VGGIGEVSTHDNSNGGTAGRVRRCKISSVVAVPISSRQYSEILPGRASLLFFLLAREGAQYILSKIQLHSKVQNRRD